MNQGTPTDAERLNSQRVEGRRVYTELKVTPPAPATGCHRDQGLCGRSKADTALLWLITSKVMLGFKKAKKKIIGWAYVLERNCRNSVIHQYPFALSPGARTRAGGLIPREQPVAEQQRPRDPERRRLVQRLCQEAGGI